jgi:hypothetical protein
LVVLVEEIDLVAKLKRRRLSGTSENRRLTQNRLATRNGPELRLYAEIWKLQGTCLARRCHSMSVGGSGDCMNVAKGLNEDVRAGASREVRGDGRRCTTIGVEERTRIKVEFASRNGYSAESARAVEPLWSLGVVSATAEPPDGFAHKPQSLDRSRLSGVAAAHEHGELVERNRMIREPAKVLKAQR